MRPNDGFCVSWTMIRNRMCLCHHFCHPKLKIWRPLNHLDVTWPWSREYLNFQNFQKRTKICTSECILDVGGVTHVRNCTRICFKCTWRAKGDIFRKPKLCWHMVHFCPLGNLPNGHDLFHTKVKYGWLQVCSYSWKYLSHLSISPDKMTYKWHNLSNVNTKC